MAQIKSYDTFQNVKDHIKKGRILSKGAELTVSSAGSITVTDSYHLVKGATDQDALTDILGGTQACLLYTSPSPRDLSTSRMPSSA